MARRLFILVIALTFTVGCAQSSKPRHPAPTSFIAGPPSTTAAMSATNTVREPAGTLLRLPASTQLHAAATPGVVSVTASTSNTSPVPTATLPRTSTPTTGPNVLAPGAVPADARWDRNVIFFDDNGSISTVRFDGSGRTEIVRDEVIQSVSPDGTKLISANENRVLLRTFMGDSIQLKRAVRYLWSGDSRFLAIQVTSHSPQERNDFELWDLSSMALRRQFSVDGELVGIAVRNNGNTPFETLNASDYDPGPLDLEPGYYEYDLATGELVELGGYDPSIRGYAPGGRRRAILSPDGGRLAISADGINIWTYDLVNGELMRRTDFSVDPYPGGVGNIRWSPNGKYIAFEQFEIFDRETGRFENRIAILDLTTNRVEIISDTVVTNSIELPPDFDDNQSFFKPMGWDETGTAVFVYFEATTKSESFGHLDDNTYPDRRRMHSYWLLDIHSMQIEELSWLGEAHVIFPAH